MDQATEKPRRPRANGKGEAAKANTASVTLAKRGITSSEDFRNLMGAMMTDVIQGNVSPDVVNAACNAGRGLLKMIELEYRAASPQAGARPSLPVTRRIGSVASA